MSPGGGMTTVSRAVKATAPYTRRSGWAKLEAVYWVAGDGSGNPQSHAGPRRVRRADKRWETRRGGAQAVPPDKAVNRASETPPGGTQAVQGDRVRPPP